MFHLKSKLTPLTACTLLLAALTFTFSCICQWINIHYHHYIGNPYLPTYAFNSFILLALIYAGIRLITNKKNYFLSTLQRAIIVYCCLWLLVFITDSVQYTPFPTIDHLLIKLDRALYFDTNLALNGLFQFPLLVHILSYAYAFLQIELLLFILAMIFNPNQRALTNSLFLLLSTAIIGFSCYYFFPTMAPASLIDNHHFFKEQLDTSLKFRQIHHHYVPTTLEGGLIAMPSFHCIWSLICQYYTKDWPLIWWLLLPMTILILFACVLLGWHYLIDILAGLIIFYGCLMLLNQLNTLSATPKVIRKASI